MHQQIIHHHSTVGTQDIERDAGVPGHGVDHLADLERGGLQHGAGNVAFIHEVGQAGNHAARVVLPIWCVQAGEGGNEVDAAVVTYGSRERLNV